jgi:hypothetical protein
MPKLPPQVCRQARDQLGPIKLDQRTRRLLVSKVPGITREIAWKHCSILRPGSAVAAL